MTYYRTIQCEICDSDVQTIRPNTKYCRFHRLRRDWFYARKSNRKAQCLGCGEKFAPYPRDQQICFRCMPPPAANGHGNCAVCREPGTYVDEAFKVCGECMNDLKKQTKVGETIATKHSRLMKNPLRLPDPSKIDV